jgi:hypothetical protein
MRPSGGGRVSLKYFLGREPARDELGLHTSFNCLSRKLDHDFANALPNVPSNLWEIPPDLFCRDFRLRGILGNIENCTFKIFLLICGQFD